MSFEEHFAPEADSDDSCSIIETKRYATRSSNHEKIVKDLKIENLNQIKNKIKKEDEEQVRYLCLDNASKDVEIISLKEKINNLELILKPIQEFEEIINSINNNIIMYKQLIYQIPKKNYKELMRSEVQNIKIYKEPTQFNTITYKALVCMYSSSKKDEDRLREHFHNTLFWNAIIPKNISKQMLYYMMFIIVILISIYYMF